ncbi:WD40 repeat-like protein, partial [Glonium stellatum]
MSATLHHECARVPVTALAFCGQYLLAAEGPFLRIFDHDSAIVVLTKQIFDSQTIHGIAVHSKCSSAIIFVVWGGRSLRLARLRLSAASPSLEADRNHIDIWLSHVTEVADWILDFTFGPLIPQKPNTAPHHFKAAVITAHNALLELEISYHDDSQPTSFHSNGDSLKISVSELTASSRCILYSAHILWLSLDWILVAAGTAFGEILVWSWIRNEASSTSTLLHHVFTGHEGSIFGVQISEELPLSDPAGPRRLLASCSDDRSIRIWDISNLPNANMSKTRQEGADALHMRETGFGANALDIGDSNSLCLAIGWGHLSRVWTVQFFEPGRNVGHNNKSIQLISTGEDATSRLWELISNSPEAKTIKEPTYPFRLQQVQVAAYHSGKNMWSLAALDTHKGMKIATGSADSKIIAYYLSSETSNYSHTCLNEEWTLEQALHCSESDAADQRVIVEMADSGTPSNRTNNASKKADIFRSYAFAGESSFVATTNNGKILISNINSPSAGPKCENSLRWAVLGQQDELKGYSITAGMNPLGLVFIAGSIGSIYAYSRSMNIASVLYRVNGKVAGIFPQPTSSSAENPQLSLLVSLVGARVAQLLFVNYPDISQPCVTECVAIPLPQLTLGFTITSKILLDISIKFRYLILGSRNGSIAFYAIPKTQMAKYGEDLPQSSLIKVINEAHGRETVTSMLWIPSKASIPGNGSGYLLSTGRDGFCVVHYIDITTGTSELVHKTALPFGPNVEGAYICDGSLMVYGFRGKQFVLFNETTEEEILAIECGGAHRNWAFNPHQLTLTNPGGTLVWTQASNVKICSQNRASHVVLQDGGHGREIKSVAISPFLSTQNGQTQLIATGAEDTDIKIFEYVNTKSSSGSLRCVRTLRKHTTGIQHLQWSEDGCYLFSSGGCEEFYVWRIRSLPVIGVSAVCEAVCLPESEIPDLRIMSFAARKINSDQKQELAPEFMICMVYSDSTIRTYTYNHLVKFRLLFTGTYLTSCLTQCDIITPSTLLTAGTDGHIALWTLPPLPSQTSPPSTSPATTTPAQLTYATRAKLHQNAIKTLATHPISPTATLLITGSDDGALGLSLLRASVSISVPASTLASTPASTPASPSASTSTSASTAPTPDFG